MTADTAHSPQAKGRIERLFHTLQDRLVKEMRLVGIATLATGRIAEHWRVFRDATVSVAPPRILRSG